MSVSLWLALKELAASPSRLLLALAVIAAPVSLVVAVEMASVARGRAAAVEIDHIGAPLRLLPRGVSQGQVARFSSQGGGFSEPMMRHLENKHQRTVRAVDIRLVTSVELDGRTTPVIGVDPALVISPHESLRSLRRESLVIGAELARARGVEPGDAMQAAGVEFTVTGVLPETGTQDDVAAFLPLGTIQQITGRTDEANVANLYLHPGFDAQKVKAELVLGYPELEIVLMPRGEVADRKTGDVLRFNRRALYAVGGLALVLCLVLGSTLNVVDRRFELATLTAIGCSGRMLQQALLIRSAVLTIAGSLLGSVVGAVTAALQVSPHLPWPWPLLASVLFGSTVLSILVTLPVTAWAVRTDPVSCLQDGAA